MKMFSPIRTRLKTKSESGQPPERGFALILWQNVRFGSFLPLTGSADLYAFASAIHLNR
jgi:hypothetical protein